MVTPVKFTDTSVNRTIKEHRAKGGRVEIRDAATTGLALRIGARDVLWTLKLSIAGKERRIEIGDATLMSVNDARALAAKHRAEAKSGGDPTLSIIAKKTTTLIELIDLYLVYVKDNLRKATYDDYRKVLKNNLHLKELHKSPVKALKRNHFNEITDKIFREGKHTSALAFVNRISGLWTWALDQEIAGVSEMRLRRPTDSREMTDEEVNTEAEEHEAKVPSHELLHSFEKKAAALSDVNFAVAMTVMHTAQRRHTVVEMRGGLVRILDDGWGAWRIPRAHRKMGAVKMKSKKAHFIPLHPSLVKILKPHLAAAKDNNGFVFPVTRRRYKDKPPINLHLNEDTVTHNFDEIDAGFSPHIVRHAFSTYLVTKFKYTEKDLKIILDHTEGVNGDVTLEHYVVDAQELKKREMLSNWVGFWTSEPEKSLDLDTMRGAIQRLAHDIASRPSS